MRALEVTCMDLYDSVVRAADFIASRTHIAPHAGVILGTGLGGLADDLEVETTIPYKDIPGFRPATVVGHRGRLIMGTMAGRPVVVMDGRFHYYEGLTLQEATLPVRVIKRLGADVLIINSAAGGLNPLFKPADIMIATDHVNLLGDNPLRGVFDDRLGPRFPDMRRPYDPQLIKIATRAALELRIPVRHGVYVAVSGPSLETPAETRFLRLLGADAVGMSTVPEVIVARQAGLRVLVMAVITNVNLPDAMRPITVEQVVKNANRARSTLAKLLKAIMVKIH
uniref:Purine nucleoside phosphorylase n=1 Tax=Desulfomonile tiedjei TaxID=2358 RepID=A0A7C4EWY9_9BACT